jgi:nucleoid DNA-binding protein
MTKADLVRTMAQGTDITSPHAGQALCILLQTLQLARRRGERVTLVGFATFGVRSRVTCRGRNPQPACS